MICHKETLREKRRWITMEPKLVTGGVDRYPKLCDRPNLTKGEKKKRGGRQIVMQMYIYIMIKMVL